MAALLQKVPDRLQLWIEQLGRRLHGSALHPLLLPLAAVHVDKPAGSFTDLMEARAPPRDEDDVLALYAIARVGIHLAHAVTSPWYFSFTREVARRARWAALWQASRKPLGEGEAANVRSNFAELVATLFDAAEGFSVYEVLETHAIVEGLQASMARPSALAAYRFGVELYRGSPQNLRLLSRLIECFGIEIAMQLAPRLCAVTLKFPFPAIALNDLLKSLEGKRERVPDLLAMSAERFVGACRLDVLGAARSARQTPEADPSAELDPWTHALGSFFDRYEALDSDEARLQAMFHPMKATPETAPHPASSLFCPVWGLFSDGQVADLRPGPGNLSDFARWITSALDLSDGLAWLGEARR